MIKFMPLILAMPMLVMANSSVERRFETGTFERIALESSDSVNVIQGDRFSITADGDPGAVAALVVERRDDVLHIDRVAGRSSDKGAMITVRMPRLAGASIHGSGAIRVGSMISPSFSGAVAGSGDLSLNDAQFEQAYFSISGSGEITAAGRAQRVNVNVGGSGRIDTHKLIVRDTIIAVHGSGDAYVTASHAATVSVGGTGRVKVVGGAQCSIDRHGDGIAKCR